MEPEMTISSTQDTEVTSVSFLMSLQGISQDMQDDLPLTQGEETIPLPLTQQETTYKEEPNEVPAPSSVVTQPTTTLVRKTKKEANEEFGVAVVCYMRQLATMLGATCWDFFYCQCDCIVLRWNAKNTKKPKLEATLATPVAEAVVEVGTTTTNQLLEVGYTYFHVLMNMFQHAHKGKDHRLQPTADEVFYFLSRLLCEVVPDRFECYSLLWMSVHVTENTRNSKEDNNKLLAIWANRHEFGQGGGCQQFKDFVDSLYLEFACRVIRVDDVAPVCTHILVGTFELLKRCGLRNLVEVRPTAVTKTTNKGRRMSANVDVARVFYNTVSSMAILLCHREKCTRAFLEVTLSKLDLISKYQLEMRSRAAKRRSSARCQQISRMPVEQVAEEKLSEKQAEEENTSHWHEYFDQWHLMKVMTPEQRIRYDSVLSMGNDAHSLKQLAVEDNFWIQVEGIKRLSGNGCISKWLNQDILHYVFSMMGRREVEMSKTESCGRCYCLAPSFYERLTNTDAPPPKKGTFDYGNVKKWTKKCPTKNIFNLRRLLFPIHHHDVHWVLGDVDFVEKTISIWDSYDDGTVSEDEEDELLVHKEMILMFILCEYERLFKRAMPAEEQNQWRCLPTPTVKPLRQQNSDDCGVLTIIHADLILRGITLTPSFRKSFNSKHNYPAIIKRCRERLAAMVMEKMELPLVLE